MIASFSVKNLPKNLKKKHLTEIKIFRIYILRCCYLHLHCENKIEIRETLEKWNFVSAAYEFKYFRWIQYCK